MEYCIKLTWIHISKEAKVEGVSMKEKIKALVYYRNDLPLMTSPKHFSYHLYNRTVQCGVGRNYVGFTFQRSR